MLGKGTIKKIVLVGVSFGLTLSGTIVQISQKEKISGGRGHGKSLRFESIDDVKTIIDSIPSSSAYQLLSSSNEEARKNFDLGENFHSLTLNNRLDRKYEMSTKRKKVRDEGVSYQNSAYKGKTFYETDFTQDHSSSKEWPYLYSQNEMWNTRYVTETFNNALLSYYTDNGLLLEFDVTYVNSYRDYNTLKEHGIFDGISSNYENYTYKDISTEIVDSKLETILKGAIYITDGTAFLKYDRYENNYSYNTLVRKDEKFADNFDEIPREFDEAFYQYFPDARPGEEKVIRDSMNKSIEKNYGKYFDLRFSAEEVSMPKIPTSESEMNSMSEKEIKKLMSSYALAMITPILVSYCDTTIAEMIDIGNIPMDQLHLNLDYYSAKDDSGNLLNSKKDGRLYKLEENNLKEFLGGYLETTGVLAKGQYKALCEEKLLNDVNYQRNDYGLESFFEEIENSNDLVAKNAMQNYKNIVEETTDVAILNEAERTFYSAVQEFAKRTRKVFYDPGYTDSAKAFLTLLDDTAPTFYVDFRSSEFEDLFGISHRGTYKDTFSIMDVDNTVIKAPKKIRKNVYDLYKDAMDEYANTMYEQYKK